MFLDVKSHKSTKDQASVDTENLKDNREEKISTALATKLRFASTKLKNF